jgi:hypoxanthine phosphoribosyltransferase
MQGPPRQGYRARLRGATRSFAAPWTLAVASAPVTDAPRSEAIALREIVSAERVRARVADLVAELARDYADARLAFVVIAEGARRFADALLAGLRASGLAPEVHVLRVRRTRGRRLEDVRLDSDRLPEVLDRDVLVVDDIVDEGRTLEAVLERIEQGSPRSLRVAVLVSKLARRLVPVDLDYVGFEVADGWVVGLGMDLDGAYRELDHLALAEPVPKQEELA